MPRTSSKNWDRWRDEQKDRVHAQIEDREEQRKHQQARLQLQRTYRKLLAKKKALAGITQ